MRTTSSRPTTNDDLRERREAARWDDRVLAAMMIAFGGLRVGIAIGGHERFTAEPTLAAIMLGVGILILARRN